MTLATYRWLEEHGDFRFGSGADKRPLREWRIKLGYLKEETAEEIESSESANDHSLPEEQKEVPQSKLSLEETWAYKCVEDIHNITFLMPEGVYGCFEKALKQANKFFGDDH